jgi:Fe-S cluster assembly iron-binding protein IscA
MATGRLGAANITTTAATTAYTVPATTFSVVSVNVVNRSSSAAAQIRIAVSSSGTPGLDEWIEYDSSLVANGVLERTGIVMDAGKYIVVQTPTSTPALSVVVYGIETSTA